MRFSIYFRCVQNSKRGRKTAT